ncbi:SDR family NAD(P)-dependent oxidoreductase [Streptomyces guryensis]|uniref:SDR family oxidoreductase n=1 Tax=Streptomyces guryensis TaxID=2886947 RepID=A0A9Q3VRV9_9ACTN|nr:SDR family oxidoreductase [Streptomyces guryensis]MCD9877336.1 SDR family oxidoreductase [Streptomyces guryensis]
MTGASAGIGKATAKRFAENDDKVILIARQEKRLAQAAREIESSVPGADVEPLVLDMSDAESAGILRDRAGAAELPLGGLLCCAGAVPAPGDNDDGDVGPALTEWQEAYRSNVMTSVVAVEGLLPLMTDGGSIVLYSSIAAYRGSGGTGGYGAAKAALHSYVHTLATRLGPRGISANAIAPGYVADTDLFGGSLPAARETMLVRQTALGRAGAPADVAELGFYLCSKAGGYLTSQILQLNGGSSHGV